MERNSYFKSIKKLVFLLSGLIVLSSCKEVESGDTAQKTQGESNTEACGQADLSSPGFNCNGRSLNYPQDLFDVRDPTNSKKVLTESELDSANEVLLCSKVGVRFCQSMCVNQIFNFRKRYSALSTGYIWPDGKCGLFLFNHNGEKGLTDFEYFLGSYVNGPSSVVGNCEGINLNDPTLSGYYSFLEKRVPQGVMSPSPDGSRLYYVLNLQDYSNSNSQEIILQNYQPMPDSRSVWSFSMPMGSVYPHYQQIPGYSCVKREEVSEDMLSLIK
jgi:hypothetical protein